MTDYQKSIDILLELAPTLPEPQDEAVRMGVWALKKMRELNMIRDVAWVELP